MPVSLSISEIGLSADIVRQLQIQYDALSDGEKAEFDKNYRATRIDSNRYSINKWLK